MEKKVNMKQHIAPEQLDELLEKGRKNLQEWYVSEEGDWIAWKSTSRQKYWGKEVVYEEPEQGWGIGIPGKKIKGLALPLLSLGQMVDFLAKHSNSITINQNPPFGWEVWLDSKKRFITTDNEPITALWGAVKEVLEKNEHL